MKREVRIDGQSVWLEIQDHGDSVEFQSGEGQPGSASILEVEPGVYSVLVNGKSYRALVARGKEQTLVSVNGHEFLTEVIDPRSRTSRQGSLGADGHQVLTAPMPGKVVRVLVQAGDRVEAGQGIVVVEAMKMQNEMKAVREGTVISVSVSEGSTVAAGDTLATIE